MKAILGAVLITLAAAGLFAPRVDQRGVDPPRSTTRAVTLLANTDAPIKLGADPLRVALMPVHRGEARSLPVDVAGLSSHERLLLVLKGVRAEKQPGIVYELFLDVPESMPLQSADGHHVATLNFFGAVPPPGVDVRAGSDALFASYDVTDVARNLASRGLLGKHTTLTIAPIGQPTDGARAQIARIELARQPGR